MKNKMKGENNLQSKSILRERYIDNIEGGYIEGTLVP